MDDGHWNKSLYSSEIIRLTFLCSQRVFTISLQKEDQKESQRHFRMGKNQTDSMEKKRRERKCEMDGEFIMGILYMEHAYPKNLNHSRGFAVMALVIVFSVFFSAMLLLIAMSYGLKHSNQVYSLCYQTGALIQNQLKNNLIQLLKLNPKATELRIKRKQAEIQYQKALATGLLPYIKVAKAQLEWVKAKQRVHVVRQKKWIKKSQVDIQTDWIRFKNRSQKWIQKARKIKQIPLAVETHPSNSDSPDYVLQKNFSKKQQIKMIWDMNIFDQVPKPVKDLFSLGVSKKHQCAVSLSYQRQQFFIQLMKP